MSERVLVVLHGANGCAREMEPLAAPLRTYGRVIAHDLPGHGGRELPDRLSIEDQAKDVIARLDREGIAQAVVVGYSLGGYLAIYLTRHYPQRIQGACGIAIKYVFDPETIKYWTYLAQPDRLARPGNPRAGEMLAAHGPNWRAVTLATSVFFGDLGARPPLSEPDLRAIERPVLLVGSNRDAIVKWDETMALGRLIPNARLAMFYGLAHPLRNVPVTRVGEVIGQWLREQVTA